MYFWLIILQVFKNSVVVRQVNTRRTNHTTTDYYLLWLVTVSHICKTPQGYHTKRMDYVLNAMIYLSLHGNDRDLSLHGNDHDHLHGNDHVPLHHVSDRVRLHHVETQIFQLCWPQNPGLRSGIDDHDVRVVVQTFAVKKKDNDTHWNSC